MKRSKHNLSHYKLLTSDMGELTPVSCFEVLPGDSVQQATSLLLRVSPLLAPVMHPVMVRVHHWYVPYRLLWDGWEDFITGGSDGEGGSSGAFPTLDPAYGVIPQGSLLDYLGVPPGLNPATISVSALPYRAYNMIFNEHYRDQDLVALLPVSTASGVDSITGPNLQHVAWEKDYFTMARPWPQKGPDVTLPLGTRAQVLSDAALAANVGIYSTAQGAYKALGAALANVDMTAVGSTVGNSMYADLSTATAVNVTQVREAFALQRYEEARAMYGSRYTEYLRYLGVRSSDSRLQRPEYLGGGKQTIAFTEILQTGPTTSGAELGVGNLKGHGIAAMRSRKYRRFFEEHGVVLSLLSVRPRTMYGNGFERYWSKRTKEEFWQKELESIGQQEVLNQEVYYGDSIPGDVFGYSDRYAEYRHIQSSIAGEFRSTLNYWHMARIFAGDVTLNSSFVTSDPTKRIHAVQSADVLWIMANNNIQARRLVSRGGMPGRIV